MEKPISQRMPIRNAAGAENLEIGAWVVFAIGVVVAFFSGLGILVSLGGIGILATVAIREQREVRRETRRRLERLEVLLQERTAPPAV